MKLSVFAVLLAAKPFDEACKYLANAGVQAVEIGCGGFPGKAHCDPKEFLAHPEKIDEMLATLKKYNLEIAALSTHGNCVHPNPEVARQFEEDYENTILLAEKMGVDLHKLPLRRGMFGAEPWTEEMRRHIEEGAGIRAFDIYGLSEITGPGVGAACECQCGLHIFEDHYYPEIIDPDTLEVLPDGREGELVLSTLSKMAMPMIRSASSSGGR